MKLLLIAISLFVVGCSTTPRVGDKSGADYPIALNAKSSEALIALSKTPLKGIRDLSVSEFESESVTVKEFEELNTEVENPLSSEAYALGSVAVGASLGLAFKYASGVGILGYLASDDRPMNYDFSDDFNSKGYIYSPKGSDELFDEMIKVIPDAMLSFNKKVDDILDVGIDGELFIIKLKEGESSKKGGKKSKEHLFYGTGSVGNWVGKKRIFTEYSVSIICDPKLNREAICVVNPQFSIDKKKHPLISLLVKEIAQVMPEGSLMYLPPRKDLNRIPMVYKTDGEPMYLVESK